MRRRPVVTSFGSLVALLLTLPQLAGAESGPLIRLTPDDPTSVGNCIPFGNNTDNGFTGFIYRNVPAFELLRGSKISFDLGASNDRVVRRDIYLSVANKNPEKAELVGDNVVSQGITATEWVQVATEDQRVGSGNDVSGDYELRYRVESDFSFPGGGLIIGFASWPPADYRDPGCEQVLVYTVTHDSSDYFYARFALMDHLTMDVLDDAAWGNATALGGVIIGADPPA